MKNRMLIFIAVVCVAILLTACGNNNGTNDTANNDNGSATDTIDDNMIVKLTMVV